MSNSLNATTRIALTRPAGRGDTLSDELIQAGYLVRQFPLLDIEAMPSQPPAASPVPYAVIVVSPSAATFGAAIWPASWRGKVLLLAVGAATERALDVAGWSGTLIPAQETSEGLLAMPQLEEVKGQRVLVVRGTGGRTTLAEQLTIRGALVEHSIVYRRLDAAPAIHDALARWVNEAPQPGSAIVVSSAQVLQSVCAIIPAQSQPETLRILCLGERLAGLAREHFHHVHRIDYLRADAIIGALSLA